MNVLGASLTPGGNRLVRAHSYEQWSEERWQAHREFFGLDEADQITSERGWLKRPPYPFQASGSYFLLEQEVENNGPLLADEMGLGKVRGATSS